MKILLHSSKTMRPEPSVESYDYQPPLFLEQAHELSSALKERSLNEIKIAMKLSDDMATKTKKLVAAWSDNHKVQRPAIDAFLGDIYSGLQVQSLSSEEQLCKQAACHSLRLIRCFARTR